MSLPTTSKGWKVTGKTGFDCLEFGETPIEKLGDNEVLVRIHGASLNFRDLIIPKGKYPFGLNLPVVPGSDGAGDVIAVGKNVKRWKAGDKVVTLFSQKHLGGSLDAVSLMSGLGGAVDGTLREYGAFDEEGLVRMPSNLNYIEASTLSCAGLTAWNALFGLEGRQLKPGDWVLTQGTGGVSLFALQFAKSCGASVVATTGSEDKMHILKKLGADEIINYKTTPEWGAEAKKRTGGAGFQHIVEVAGAVSMKQSLASVAIDGVITIIGFVGGSSKDKEPSFIECLSNICTVRGILVGNRVMMEDMCRAVEAQGDKLRPVIDQTVFTLDKAKDAYEYQLGQKHYGKVCIKI